MYHDTQQWRKDVDLNQLVLPKEQGGYDFSERDIVAQNGWKMCKWSSFHLSPS